MGEWENWNQTEPAKTHEPPQNVRNLLSVFLCFCSLTTNTCTYFQFRIHLLWQQTNDVGMDVLHVGRKITPRQRYSLHGMHVHIVAELGEEGGREEAVS